MIEVEADNTEIVTENSLDVTVVGSNEVVVEAEGELDISVLKREFTIVGDDIYIPMLYDDAPQWMKDLVQIVVDVSISTNNTSLINDLNSALSEFATGYVPMNQYTQSILDLGDEDTRINALLETLNSNFNDGLSDANAQIVNLDLTKAGKDEVVASVIQTIAAQLADVDSSLGATINRIDQAQVAETTARANSFYALTTSITNLSGEIQASAGVTDTIMAYVGMDEAGASTDTGLSAYLVDSNGIVGGADSKVANNVYVESGVTKSKWDYNSLLNIGGVYKKSGFGLSTMYVSGDGTAGNPYSSEFWIDASRLKFTNSDMTGSKAPFTIDATGVEPQITFNGLVSFGNISDGENTLSTWTNGNNDLFAQKMGYVNYADMETAATNGMTIIDAGSLRTSLIQANAIVASQINTEGLIAENISADEIVGKTITGGTINGARINAAIIRASYIDLNGELEILTNYIISMAMYTANPSLYTDAVYIEADNQYRIPTLSVIKESTKSLTRTGTTGSLVGVMWPYNKGNTGSNLKAASIQPTFTINNDTKVIYSKTSWYDEVASGTLTNRIRITLAGLVLFQFDVKSGIDVTLSGAFFSTINLTAFQIEYQVLWGSVTKTLNIGIGTLRVTLEKKLAGTYIAGTEAHDVYMLEMNATLLAGDKTFPANWNDGSRLTITQSIVPYAATVGGISDKTAQGSSTFYLNNNITINNML